MSHFPPRPQPPFTRHSPLATIAEIDPLAEAGVRRPKGHVDRAGAGVAEVVLLEFDQGPGGGLWSPVSSSPKVSAWCSWYRE